MKRFKIGFFVAGVLMISFLTGCTTRLPGQPTEAERWRAPTDVTDFSQLYAQNCAGCHGVGGRLGAALPLNDPLYLSFVTDEALRTAISKGRPGTNMPAFSQQVGGSLTDQQIELVITGMRRQWSRPDELKGVELPSYSVNGIATSNSPKSATVNDYSVNPSQTSDAQRGAVAYQTYCAGCHGVNGAGGTAGSIVDPYFLNLVSNQGLRTTVVVGRSDLGKPDWRSNVPGHPMSSQEIDDVVAWVAMHRQTAEATSVTATEGTRAVSLQAK
ncbi:MAG: c-type cytochrome [Pyrinomonadaceae bacterium]|nr:c-type cytochrome [Pyrinomonadaceae bacterium]